MSRAHDSTLTGLRRWLAAATLGALAAAQTAVGVWALTAPASFYAGFPGAGHAWVALLPPYNDHLVRDVGALSLAVGLLVGFAAVLPTRLLVRVAVCTFVTYALPHTAFHALHLDGMTGTDAVVQMAGFVVQLSVAAAALATTVDIRHPVPVRSLRA